MKTRAALIAAALVLTFAAPVAAQTLPTPPPADRDLVQEGPDVTTKGSVPIDSGRDLVQVGPDATTTTTKAPTPRPATGPARAVHTAARNYTG